MKTKVKYSPWLRFYLCPACGAHDEKSDLLDPTGPCPKCGDDSLVFLIGRWRIEQSENTLLQDIFLVYQEPVFTAEFRKSTAPTNTNTEEGE